MSIFKNLCQKFNDNDTLILTIGGLILGGAALIAIAKEAPKAKEELDAVREEIIENEEEYTTKDKVVAITKAVGPHYIVPVALECLSVGCIIAAYKKNSKRAFALATAYQLTDTAYREYKNHAEELLTDKQKEEIKDKIAEKKVKNAPKEQISEAVMTGTGTTLCYDSGSGRYFYSSPEYLKKVQNKINDRLIKEMFISGNELQYELGLCSSMFGNELGWNVENGLLDFNFSSQLTDDDKPCLVLSYDPPSPRYLR